MKLSEIFAVTICIDGEIEETHHVYCPDGVAPTEAVMSPKILPLIRMRVHPASNFEIIDVIDVQSSVDAYNRL